MSQSKQKLLTQAPLATPPDSGGVTYTPATNVAWPTWVINEMSNAIYKSRWPEPGTPLFAALDDSQRKPYIDMCRGALAWIEGQGWVKLGK